MPDGSYEIRVSARVTPAATGSSRAHDGRAPDSSRLRLVAVKGAHVSRSPAPYSFGGPDARFGAARTGHVHQGQDVMAAEGTPVVAPAAGVISYRGYQASGAGYYVVLDADGEPYDYVFMHLQSDSAGHQGRARYGRASRSGTSGTPATPEGPHLHFEVWDGPWYDGGHAIDPLPFLRAWATATPGRRCGTGRLSTARRYHAATSGEVAQ